MIRLFSKIFLKMAGWTVEVNLPDNEKKAVLLVAPHTSNLDFYIGRFVFNVLRLKARFLIKKEAFKWPFGSLLRKMGGIPVDRGRSSSLVTSLAREFEKTDELMLIVTPEGTRKYTPYWKKGFYYIAVEAQVPIALGFLDYKQKRAGIADVFYPTGNLHEDFETIRSYYKNLSGRYPKQFCQQPAIK